ncbi:hypothetical protein IAQ61_009120 [Plenodomus lingam]|uniref:Predicted protein n=1 Tax=Leptosphaeria maculans (strain JN3 / isolate v23.1.3 / race Av1-4-5-6-7-8) TaxID=985895 RepID=E4ZPP1_LEPMJ|nr:predicted protein [Plenodomus lingam JN3]KAH9865173.1 hypothetical protein IAQ61_009120 [Plenodomus lingam]CBX93426.1 predicted protein [Plenodomus lingam JN3]
MSWFRACWAKDVWAPLAIGRISAPCEGLCLTSDKTYWLLQTIDWEALKTALRKRYMHNDSVQHEEQTVFFEQWLRDCQSTTPLNIREYLEEFQIRIERCIAADMVEREKKGYYLEKGLPVNQTTKILQKFNLSTRRVREFNFNMISSYLLPD